MEAILLFRGHLVKSEEISLVTVTEGVLLTSGGEREARNAAEHPTTCRTALRTK